MNNSIQSFWLRKTPETADGVGARGQSLTRMAKPVIVQITFCNVSGLQCHRKGVCDLFPCDLLGLHHTAHDQFRVLDYLLAYLLIIYTLYNIFALY